MGLALTMWGGSFVNEQLAVLSDNLASLQSLLDLKGHGPMLKVAPEIAWRKARGRWPFAVGHWPSEQNVIADALSRIKAPEKKELPRSLRTALYRQPLEPRQFWKVKEMS